MYLTILLISLTASLAIHLLVINYVIKLNILVDNVVDNLYYVNKTLLTVDNNEGDISE